MEMKVCDNANNFPLALIAGYNCVLFMDGFFSNRMLPVRHPKEMPSFASHVLEWAGPGGCPQPPQVHEDRGVPSTLIPPQGGCCK